MNKKNMALGLKKVLANKMKDVDFSIRYEQECAINDIARLIRAARLKLGLTQMELAKRAGTTQSVVARLESGADRRTPSLDLLGRLAHALRSRLRVQFQMIDLDR